jgi:hypothetical protein
VGERRVVNIDCDHIGPYVPGVPADIAGTRPYVYDDVSGLNLYSGGEPILY